MSEGRLPPTALDVIAERVAALGREHVTDREKGIPAGTDVPLAQIGAQGWNIRAGDLPFPLLVLRDDAIDHNIALLQTFCDENGAWLAPHGKTSMAPQLFARQLAAGAWAMTAANIAQVQVMRSFGVPRILIANELASSYDIRYVGTELAEHPEVEIISLVDSPASVDRLVSVLRSCPLSRPLPLLVELGSVGGRCGARNLDDLVVTAREVAQHPALLRLVGVQGYEGSVDRGGAPLASSQHIERIDKYLSTVDEAVALTTPFVTVPPVLVSCGGSMFPDRVVAALGPAALPDAQLVLRSGGYISHDEAFYGATSPFGTQSLRSSTVGTLRPAFELWASVLSRLEPERVILQMGRRDFPMDQGWPVVKERFAPDGVSTRLDGAEFFAADDQHAYLRVPEAATVGVGDTVVSGINHPCAAFDRWRVIPLIDAARDVVGAIRTFF